MKKISIILTLLLSMFIMDNVYASSAKISISPTSKTILVGNSITITVTTSSDTTLGAVSYTLDYDKNILSLTKTTSPTGGARTVGYFSTKGNKTLSYTYTFKALKSGSTTLSIIGAEAGDDNGTNLSITKGSATIKVITQKELEATYSSNNNLSSLSIDGYNLEPSFNKNTTSYTVSLKPETETIKVNASKEDYRATINGIGEIHVSEGVNTIKIDVVAQNGNIKSYTIIATVLEYDPINVNVDGIDYTVVRSKKVLDFSNSLFTETTINISSYDVPAYFNELTNTTLVALKDSDGNINYFIYDNNTYKKFNELKLGLVDLMVSDGDIPKYFNKTTININDIEYTGYKYSNTSRYALIYGTNLVNGNTSYYLYDNYEGTLQRYDDGLILKLDSEIDKDKKIIYILIGTSSGLFILLMLSLFLRIKKKKKNSGD